MQIVIHRVNTVAGLLELPSEFGVELDVRSAGGELILHHDPHQGGERFADYLEHYRHGLMVINIKEAGLEEEALSMVRNAGVENFFLLDVEFPYLYRAAEEGERSIAVRYSEVESMDTVKYFAGKVDWVWMDCFTHLPVKATTKELLADFKICLVCPERWGRPNDIPSYREQLKRAGLEVDAIMTARGQVPAWESSGV